MSLDKNILRSYGTFGSPMSGRSFNAPGYKYGFNGKEKDDETKGGGNSYDFGDRIFDPRLGRWLSLDPLMAKYPYFSPYIFTANNPIYYVDRDGREIIINYKDARGNNQSFTYKPKMAVSNYPVHVKEAIKTLDAIHNISTVVNKPQDFNITDPSPQEVISNLAKATDFKLNLNVLTKEEWKKNNPSGLSDGETSNFLSSNEAEGTINWSPEIGVVEVDDQGKESGLTRSPMTILSHEIKHGFNLMKKLTAGLKAIKDDNFKNASEKSAVGFENTVGFNKENPEGERTSYSKGKTVEAKSPTDNKGKKPIKRDK